ncbi:uncharacterized protein J8A68_003336 [[Candida] subhashii]|uniref:Uncharacterized protein n=1 Tax=[Candida] subhashii TaxID=561895 RepID=A0A8J5QMN1_9ASCO|nr:uncharacterized protein J8A68_003336 [[Candida] subhashii]KAG7663158.1 hypothetical protein J8A68_003336 [[Candida] subhashii]
MDTNTYITPNTKDSTTSQFSEIPENWVEFYTSDEHHEIHPDGITLLLHETANQTNLTGEISFAFTQETTSAIELSLVRSSYFGIGFVPLWAMSLLLAGSLAPEWKDTRSLITTYTCPVAAGKSVGMKVFPNVSHVVPWTREVRFSERLRTFIMDSELFQRHEKVRLLALTGYEDVECFYTDLGPNEGPYDLINDLL